ncbi:hypothetical protein KQ940_13310 [Marinobacterium sp. D7]|uniref:hypothetical protein n=1 Tax=Marinobacterium ramblicola TaxID=2849041 RepID=UPI001C2D092B|nr:hypothetical protein [Marinobacterium ramblicola]MBV1789030.1 hypothetical protein [Marinobacterium ramblicola]
MAKNLPDGDKLKKRSNNEWDRLKEHQDRQNEIKRWKQTDWRKDALAPHSKPKRSSWDQNGKIKPLSDTYVKNSLPWLLAISLIFNMILLRELLIR